MFCNTCGITLPPNAPSCRQCGSVVPLATRPQPQAQANPAPQFSPPWNGGQQPYAYYLTMPPQPQQVQTTIGLRTGGVCSQCFQGIYSNGNNFWYVFVSVCFYPVWITNFANPHKTISAYALMSSAFRTKTTYQAFKEGYATTVRVDVANVAPRIDGTGNVDLTLNAVDQNHGSILRRTFVGYLHVIPGGDFGSWCLDGGKFGPPESTNGDSSIVSQTGPPPTSSITDANASVAYVKEHYRLWNTREYRTMYGMFSKKMETKYR